MVINSAVLEHIEDPNKFLSDINFCLTSKGKLFIAVPNEKYALLNGNVGMFVHVHINYITPEIITGLLLNNGFKVLSVLDKPDQPLYIFAEKIGLPSKTFNWSNILTSSIKYCAVYQDKVEENIQKFSHISREIGKTIIGLYGATFETANLISWARSGIKNIDFIVFDSDMRKVGSAYSGIPGIVKAPDDLNQVEDIIITPFRYQNDIYDYAQPYLKGNTKLYKLYN
jgi:hypothetical protein